MTPKQITKQTDKAIEAWAKALNEYLWADYNAPRTIFLNSDDYNTLKEELGEVSCECGVDKTGVGGLHSDWCPKHV